MRVESGRRVTPRGRPDSLVPRGRATCRECGLGIEGALNIPLDDIERLAPIELPDLNSGIAVCCKTGKRSELAAITLHELGYKRVYDMGALTEWEYGFVTVD